MIAKVKPTEILAKPYRRELTPDEGGGYTATIQEFPGLVAHGEQPNEALSKLESAALSWIETALATGYPIREPQNFDEFSGKIALRISRRLHQLAAQQAEREGTSLNALLSNAIAHYLGQVNMFSDAMSCMSGEVARALRANKTFVVIHEQQQAISNLRSGALLNNFSAGSVTVPRADLTATNTSGRFSAGGPFAQLQIASKSVATS